MSEQKGYRKGNLMNNKLKSRKFWFAVVGAILPVIAQAFTKEIGCDQAVTLSVGVLASYIFGQGYVDGQAVAKKESTNSSDPA